MDRTDLNVIYEAILACDVDLSVKKRMKLIRAMGDYFAEKRNATLFREHMDTAIDFARAFSETLLSDRANR